MQVLGGFFQCRIMGIAAATPDIHSVKLGNRNLTLVHLPSTSFERSKTDVT
jgi:hypothetical protein